MIEFIQNNPSANIPVIAENVRISESTAMRDLNKLRKLGVLIRNGARTNGTWEILKQYKALSD